MTEKSKNERFAKFLGELGHSQIIAMPPKVTRIRIFKANWVEEIEKEINEWLKSDPTIEIVRIQPHTAIMWDFISSAQPPQICNQWSEYIWTIIYREYDNND